jgi:hypothetical protein
LSLIRGEREARQGAVRVAQRDESLIYGAREAAGVHAVVEHEPVEVEAGSQIDLPELAFRGRVRVGKEIVCN